MKKIRILPLILFVAGSEIIGSLGSVFTAPSIRPWYHTLQKPPLSPPNWLFAPVWTLLFFLMGIAAYLVWSKGMKKQSVRYALFLFAVQFLFNVLWSFLFFGLKNPIYGGYCIFVLWGTIYLTIQSFAAVDTMAAKLLLPYILWVSFATYLNWGIVFVN